MADRETHLTKDVFVAGAAPRITYNPRSERHQEQELEQYLDQGPGRALTVSGPTKSGKTVLVERRLDRDSAIWIEGPDLIDQSVFWHRVVDWLGLYDLVEVSRAQDDGTGKQIGLSVGSGNVAKIDASKADSAKTTTGVRKTRTSDITTVARNGLEQWQTPVVIDDFHSVADDVKVPVARAIKTVILHTKVILIAVPHEAFDVVKREPDMGFRVAQLPIKPWSQEELEFIAERGFGALAIDDRHGIGAKLAGASYGAPFLMQELCYQYTRYFLEVERTPAEGRIESIAPGSWPEFFSKIANRTPASIFTDLLKGPKERGTKRQVRVFHDGGTTDIYGALLHATAQAGKMEVNLIELSEILERDLVEPPPRQRISLSLGHMSTIAKKQRGTGDPAVAYKEDVLNLLDPFLLFYLRHGMYSLTKDMSTPDQDQIELDTDSRRPTQKTTQAADTTRRRSERRASHVSGRIDLRLPCKAVAGTAAATRAKRQRRPLSRRSARLRPQPKRRDSCSRARRGPRRRCDAHKDVILGASFDDDGGGRGLGLRIRGRAEQWSGPGSADGRGLSPLAVLLVEVDRGHRLELGG